MRESASEGVIRGVIKKSAADRNALNASGERGGEKAVLKREELREFPREGCRRPGKNKNVSKRHEKTI